MVTAGDSTGGVRRTQAERSAAMRARLLEATVECLVTYGYAGTTTHRVAEVAGVTRGAQIHHFRAKEDLVVAAIEHLAAQRTQAAIRELDQMKVNPDPMFLLDYLWDAHQGPVFVATVELWVASRSDPVLAAQVERVEPIVNDALIDALAPLVPDHPAHKELLGLTYTAMDALRGILISSYAESNPERTRKRWDRVCEHLRPLLSDILRGGAT